MAGATITYRANPNFARDFGRLLEPMMARLALKVETEAKRNAPVRTGNLRRSITSFVATIEGKPVGVVAATANYAGFVELGTHKMAARPFLRKALIDVIHGGIA